MPRTGSVLLLFGAGLLAACGGAGEQAASMRCVPQAKLYGAAPAKFEFRRLQGEEAKKAIKAINLEDVSVGHIDVVAAEGPREEDIAILSSFRRTDASDDIGGFIEGAEGSGAKVKREGEVAWVTTAGGGTTAAAVKGCHFVMVVGDAEPVVRRLAPAVLAD